MATLLQLGAGVYKLFADPHCDEVLCKFEILKGGWGSGTSHTHFRNPRLNMNNYIIMLINQLQLYCHNILSE